MERGINRRGSDREDSTFMKRSIPLPIAIKILRDERGAVEWVYDVGSSIETERTSGGE